MKKQTKKLALAKETLRILNGAVEIEQVAGGGTFQLPQSPSDGSYTACDVCDAVRTRVC
jgi:hypothetical protein